MNKTLQVFIYGIARSGTSILSRILSSHPSAIYFHEPFLPKIKISGVQWVIPKMDTYERLLNCNFRGIIPDLPMYHLKNSIPFATWPYVEYLFGMKLVPTVTPVVYSRLVRNEAFMEKHCSKYPIKVIKEPDRMPIRELIPLLNDFPDSKIVHIWRDPVHVFKSRIDEVWCCGKCQNLTYFCSIVVEHVRNSIKLLGAFPQRYINVQYEDILRNPREAIGALLSRLEIPWHPSIDDFVGKTLRRKIPSTPTDPLPPICKTAYEHFEWYRRNISAV